MNVMWWIGVVALALFFELCHRVGFRRALAIIWDFAGEIGPRDAADRRARALWRNYGLRREPATERPPRPDTIAAYQMPGEQVHYPLYSDASDDTPVTWPIRVRWH